MKQVEISEKIPKISVGLGWRPQFLKFCSSFFFFW